MNESPMNDPSRLAEQDRALAALMGAARGYRASPRMRRRVLRLLGLPVALSLAGLASSASAGVLAVLSKVSLPTWIVMGTVAAVGSGGVVAYNAHQPAPAKPAHTVSEAARRASRLPVPTTLGQAPSPVSVAPTAAPVDSTAEQEAPRVSRPPARAPARSAATSRARRAAAGAPTRPTSAPPASAAAMMVPAPAHPAPRPAELPTTEPPATSPPPLALPLPAIVPRSRTTETRTTVLAEELALLAAADEKLRRNGADRALDVLKQYQRRFPGGSLREEAAVLEIQAQIRAGHLRAANDRARRFLVEHPTSVFAPRVRGLLSASVNQERTSGRDAPGQRRQKP
jgi:hypothetical protein